MLGGGGLFHPVCFSLGFFKSNERLRGRREGDKKEMRWRGREKPILTNIHVCRRDNVRITNIIND